MRKAYELDLNMVHELTGAKVVRVIDFGDRVEVLWERPSGDKVWTPYLPSDVVEVA